MGISTDSNAVEPEGLIMPINAETVGAENEVNIDKVMAFVAEYLPKVSPLDPAELRAKVTARAYKDNIMNDGLSSVLYVDGVIRAASFGRRIQIGDDDQDVYVGESEAGNKMAKLQMFAEWTKEGLHASQCATLGYLAVDSEHFPTPRDAGAIAVKLLDCNIELARHSGIQRIRSPSQGQFKDAVLSRHRAFAVWSANDLTGARSARSTSDYPEHWNDHTLLHDPGNQWVYTGDLGHR